MACLDTIHDPSDIRRMSEPELEALSGEIRKFLVESLSVGGGHLASNLGAVELTLAIHRVYDTRRDRLVFDVGHQCYTHKILTGRMDGFEGFREYGGMSGFPKPTESIHDAFIAGHASNSVSVALGMARARTALKQDYDVVALIGDGALNGGLAFEGLSDAGRSGEPLVVILNDNGMSINSGVGGVAQMLSQMRTRPEYLRFKRWYRGFLIPRVPLIYNALSKAKKKLREHIIPANVFDDFGFEYIGPIDGSDIHKLEEAIRWAKEQKKPCLVHVNTVKGKGFTPAERAPELYHGVGAYDPVSGIPAYSGESFSSVFGRELTELAGEDRRIVALTAAMTEGTGLVPFAETHPDRFFDVGIAEEHACAMAGGMAAQGLVPVFAVYSTFLQRSYDMLLHDVALMQNHVVLAVDRAGIVGKDGQTHQGLFDVAYLSTVPGMVIYAPSDFRELRSMLKKAVTEEKGPVALRYPRGGEGDFRDDCSGEEDSILRQGSDVTLVSYGIEINSVLSAAEKLAAQGISAEVIKLNRVCPVPCGAVLQSVRRTGVLVVAEDVCAPGCVGQSLAAACAENGLGAIRVRLLNLGDGILVNGAPEVLRAIEGLDGDGIFRTVMEVMDEKNTA